MFYCSRTSNYKSVNAVTGTENEEETIGTLADYDGTVLETEVTEPSAEELEYTEETGLTDNGVATQTVRTRTWTANRYSSCISRC